MLTMLIVSPSYKTLLFIIKIVNLQISCKCYFLSAHDTYKEKARFFPHLRGESTLSSGNR